MDNDETQVCSLSPIAKKLEAKFALVDEKKNQWQAPAASVDVTMKKPDEQTMREDLDVVKATQKASHMEQKATVKAADVEQKATDVEQKATVKASDVEQKATVKASDVEQKATAKTKMELTDDPAEDPFHSTCELSREEQMKARDDMKQGVDEPDDPDDAMSEQDEPKVIKRPAAKSKPGKKAAPKAKAKAKSKSKKGSSKAKGKEKGKNKGGKPGRPRKADAKCADLDGSSSESLSGMPDEEPEKKRSPQKRKAAASKKPSPEKDKKKKAAPTKNVTKGGGEGCGKSKGKEGNAVKAGKATFARRYQPLLDVWASKRWCAIKNAFELYVQPHVIRPSGLEENSVFLVL